MHVVAERYAPKRTFDLDAVRHVQARRGLDTIGALDFEIRIADFEGLRTIVGTVSEKLNRVRGASSAG